MKRSQLIDKAFVATKALLTDKSKEVTMLAEALLLKKYCSRAMWKP